MKETSDYLAGLTPERIAGIDVRFWERVDATGDCWEWASWCSPKGYGRASINPRKVAAHRLAWNLLIGPIGDGMHLDHRCKNPPCVNPDHLDPVSVAENNHRSSAYEAARRRSECKRGHEFTTENTYMTKGGWRRCRRCHTDWQLQYGRRTAA